MKKRWIGFLLLIASLQGVASQMYPFSSPVQDEQFTGLLKNLRCLVCQNQDLMDSNAGLAKDLRDQVYAFVKAGKTDKEVIDYLTTRYGDFILFKPPLNSVTILLWFGPLAFLMVGFLVWFACFRRRLNA